MSKISAADISEQFHYVYGHACFSASSVMGWVKYFKDGNTDIAYQLCCGQPRTTTTEDNEQEVDILIKEDCRVTGKSQYSLV
jgi:hypothetical protein